MDLYSFDDDYVRRLRDGDRWTEEHFLTYFEKLLLIKLRSRLRDAQAIDDIRQEVFFRVFRALRAADGLRDGRKLGAFVNSVCNNVLLESFRAAGRTDALDDGDADFADPKVDVEAELVTAQAQAKVRRVLARMQPKDASLLRALFLEERDKDEICRDFAVDRDYLRVLLHRAKEKFRAAYESGRVVAIAARETISGKPSLRQRES